MLMIKCSMGMVKGLFEEDRGVRRGVVWIIGLWIIGYDMV